MKILIFLFVLFGWINVSIAQTITILDKDNNNALAGVMILSNGIQTYAITNSKGKADISDFVSAEDIHIRTLGYKNINTSFADLKTKNFIIHLEPTSLNLDEIVVSATRWNQSSPDVPSKIVSINAKDVELQNPQTAADLLGISGKVFIQKSQQGGGSPMIRGFATNRLVYTVDGVRMNTAIFRGGNIQNVINLDPFATEKTEVLFGPGSVIYGSDGIGGTMSFQTLTPQFSLDEKTLVTGKAIARYSSANNERTGHLNIGFGLKKWAFITSASKWDYDHLKQGSHGPDDYIKSVFPEREGESDVVITQEDALLQIPSAYSQINLMQKIRFKPSERWDLQYGFHYSETSSYGRYDRHNRFRNGTIRYAEWDYGPQKWMMNNLSFTHDGKNAYYDQMAIRMAQQSFEESRIDRGLNTVDRNNQIENVEAYSVNVDFKKRTSANNTLYYGVEYVRNDVSSKGFVTDITTNISIDGPSRYPNSDWTSLAAYVTDELKLNDLFTLQGGLRYNRFLLNADFSNNLAFYPFSFSTTTINNGALTGSLGAVYHPSESLVVKANIGTAFRSPNVDDIGKVFDSEPGTVTVPNPQLDAEYAYNFDLAVAKIFGDMFKVDVSAFYIVLNNAMVRRNFQLNGEDSILYDNILSQVQAIQNAAVTKVYGVQAGIELKILRGLSLISDFNFQVGEEELDDGSLSSSRHAAPLFGISRLRYRRDKFTIEFNVAYQGERGFDDLPLEEQSKDEIYAKDENGNNYSPSWHTLNLKAKYQMTNNFMISGGVENLTDQRYRPYSSGISGAGRNLIISLHASF